MDTKENKILSNVIILFILLLIAVLLAVFAYARYVTQDGGTANAQVAKWSFSSKILDGTQTEEVKNFAITRTDENTQVNEETIAPGTSGEFVIEVDASRNRNVFNLQCNTRFHRQTNQLKILRRYRKATRSIIRK